MSSYTTAKNLLQVLLGHFKLFLGQPYGEHEEANIINREKENIIN